MPARLSRLSAILALSIPFLLPQPMPAQDRVIRKPPGLVTPAQHTSPPPAPLQAEPKGPDVNLVNKGTSATSARRQAEAALPWNSLDRQSQATVKQVLDSLSLFRRLPEYRFAVDHTVYQFFVKHPDVAVSTWRAMKISKMEMWQTGPTEFESTLSDGSQGVITVLSHTPASTLALCDGSFPNPLGGARIKARALLHLRTQLVNNNQGATYVQHQADLFISIPSHTLEAAAKLVSPVSNMIADKNFEEITNFIYSMSRAHHRNPNWCQHISEQLEGILPESKQQYVNLCTQLTSDKPSPPMQQAAVPLSSPR